MGKDAYYNENDPFAAKWLRQLINKGLIAPGDVDARCITEVQPDDIRGYRQVHLFAGIGGWSYSLRQAGWPDDLPVWTGSCPCQPFSGAGKGLGVKDPRHLWPEFMRLIRECQPSRIFGEQVESAIRHGWLDGVFADLEAEDYACGSVILGAHSVCSPHIRQRLYWVGDTHNKGLEGRQLLSGQRACERTPGQAGNWDSTDIITCGDGKSRRIKPGIAPLVDGLPRGVVPGSYRGMEINADESAEAKVMRIRGYGNAIVIDLAVQFILSWAEARELTCKLTNFQPTKTTARPSSPGLTKPGPVGKARHTE